MKNNSNRIALILISIFFINCYDENRTLKTDTNEIDVDKIINLLTDIQPISKDGSVNAIIEIPAGSLEKWELNKTTGRFQRDSIDGKPRTIHYLGYLGNYGMIPQTLLSKEKGGDGDPLDILVLGPSVKRGEVLNCKIIGVLNLLDRNEQDDKLIAISKDSPLYAINSIEELDDKHHGISDIIKLWFTNYKGPVKVEATGFQNDSIAQDILKKAIQGYKDKPTRG